MVFDRDSSLRLYSGSFPTMEVFYLFDSFSLWAAILIGIGALFIIGAIVSLFFDGGFIPLVIIGVPLILFGFGVQSDNAETQFEVQSPGQACALENAREVPSAVTLSTTKDTRVGLIYPCYFLLDQGIQPGMDGEFDPVPMKLQGEVNEALFADQNFTAEGSIGGAILVGIGGIGGSYGSQQTTERVQVVAFMAETGYGYASFVVETGSVRYKECAEECAPSVRIWTSSQPLFTKNLDDQKDNSIWLTKEDSDPVISMTRSGVPLSPGQTVQALATRIVVELPVSMMPGANSLSTD